MVRIRLQRGGRTNRPHYRVVVCDRRERRDGNVLENLGHYDPLAKGDKFVINKDRAEHWMSVGAVPSLTVKQYMKKLGVTMPDRSTKSKKKKAAAAS